MTRRKDGRWQEVVTINGKTKYFYGKTKAEVLRKLREYEEKQENGPLFSEVVEAWWEEKEPTLELGSLKGYVPAKNRALQNFGQMYIKDIVPVNISRAIKQFSLTHAEKNVKNQLMVYNLIFKYAVEMGYIMYNPARDISIPQGLPKTKRTSPPQAEIETVKTSYSCTFGLFAYMALYTGMRRGELLALTWEDFDFENRLITIDKAVAHDGNTPYLKLPKTEMSIGKIPMLDALRKILIPSKGLVFPNSNGEYLSKKQFEWQWRLYTEETGITSTPHQLRHAFATMLFEADIPPEEMQILLRHAQLSTTMDIYTDIREQKQKKVWNKVYSVDI